MKLMVLGTELNRENEVVSLDAPLCQIGLTNLVISAMLLKP